MNNVQKEFEKWVSTCETSSVEVLIDSNLQGKNQRAFIRLVNTGLKDNAFLFLKCKTDNWFSYKEVFQSALSRSGSERPTYEEALFLLKVEFMERAWWTMARSLNTDKAKALPVNLEYTYSIK